MADKKRFSLKSLGITSATKKTWEKVGPHAITIAGFLGLEKLAKDLGEATKKKILEEAPRGKLLNVIFELSPDAQEKLTKHLKRALRNYTEDELVTLLCKLEVAQKTTIDPKTKKTIVIGGYKEALEKLALLPKKGPGLTFDVAIELLRHDRWKQLAKRGVKIVKSDVPKKTKKQMDSFTHEMNKLCDELDNLF